MIGSTLNDHESKIQDMATAVNNQVGALTVGMTGIQHQMQSVTGIQQHMQTMSTEWNAMKQQQQNQGTQKRNQPIWDSKAIQGIKGCSGELD